MTSREKINLDFNEELQHNNLTACNDNVESVELKASFDAGWQRRGTGHAYNSLSGSHSYLVILFLYMQFFCIYKNFSFFLSDRPQFSNWL